MNISRKRLYIGGMKCVNCQNKIEQVVKKTPGVESAKVSYQKGTADIAFDPDWVTLEELRKVIREAGYEVLLGTGCQKTGFRKDSDPSDSDLFSLLDAAALWHSEFAGSK